jgi:large subunit ribosomal protein L17
MPKPRRGKLLGGSSSHEDQIIGNLIASLIEFEKIETTLTKAKVTKPYADKVITKAKKGSLHDRRQVLKFIQNKADKIGKGTAEPRTRKLTRERPER